MFSVTEALSETGYLWLLRSLSPLSKRGGSDGSEGLCPAPSLWGPVDRFAQKVVVCVLETGPLRRAVAGTAQVQVLTRRGSCGCTKSRPRSRPPRQAGLCFLFSSGKRFASSRPVSSSAKLVGVQEPVSGGTWMEVVLWTGHCGKDVRGSVLGLQVPF